MPLWNTNVFYKSFELICIVVVPSCPCAVTPTQGPMLFIVPGPELALDEPVPDCLFYHIACSFLSLL